MRIKIRNVLDTTIVTTVIVWATGFFGYWGTTHTILVMGLIIAALVMVFIRFINEDNFL